MAGIANDNDPAPARASACPLCGKPVEAKYRPFCSKHCADVDLARWLGGRYAIPVVEEEDEDGDALRPPGGEGGER